MCWFIRKTWKCHHRKTSVHRDVIKSKDNGSLPEYYVTYNRPIYDLTQMASNAQEKEREKIQHNTRMLADTIQLA